MKTRKTTSFMLQLLAQRARTWSVVCTVLALTLLFVAVGSNSILTARSVPTPRMSSQLPAFEGYGANATGGAGQPVVTVTNLNNSGAGSLREAPRRPTRSVPDQH